ncbi:PREDICTED: putative disease resistance protein RGA3 [Fragaria vesca subsp. vesca]|uniref:putative disease resistance protein RGA3 n=1 Tax=Fragaria vesca subsp. vesca TaxID=101020 RepID=UPI0002C33F4A|nr:PREDICTED: putative disease resistance protein RGA3 [Fragaria vesca subsp. vesca]
MGHKIELDDVQSPNSHQWEELTKPLRNGAVGSRILVTTRKEEVVTLMKANAELMPLKKLGETFCLSLFYYHANIDESIVSKEFHDIGLELVKRCNGGLPLATKTLGSLIHLELDDSERKEVSKIRYLCLLHATKSDSLVSLLCNYKRLRSLTMIDSFNRFIGSIFESIVQLKSLGAITLCPEWTVGLEEIPETIGGLIHLRYLDLSGNKMLEEFPSAMGSLYNLQTLRLVGCKLIRRVDVERLINSRHLYVKHCDSLRLIKGIEKLSHLQRLDEFRLRGRNNLEHLKDLNQLQGSLTIQIYGHPKMADNAAILVNKPHLLQMELNFISADELSQREIMDGLQPHACLESLFISWYKGGTFSHWLSSLHSLRVLILRFCRNIKTLPLLGKEETSIP